MRTALLLEGKVGRSCRASGPGMGRDISLLFAEHGADVVLGARDVEKCEAVAEEVRALGRKAEAVALDITDQASCDAAVDTAVRVLRRASTCSSTTPSRTATARPSSDSDLDEWRRTMDVNLLGTLQMTGAAVPPMKERGGGHIVMINSMSAKRIEAELRRLRRVEGRARDRQQDARRRAGRPRHPGQQHPPRLHLGRQGRVVPRLPRREARASPARRSTSELAGETCLKYLPHSSEIAGSVLFFASDLSKPVTGQSLGVNCGHWIP